jgi:hypothetical protein
VKRTESWKRRGGWLAALLLVGVLAAYWLWREPAWAITISADNATPYPGETVLLTAHVTPASAMGSQWQWNWSAASGVINGTTATVQYTSDMVGEHHVHLKVRSSRGTEHSAEAVVTVAVPPYSIPFESHATSEDPYPDEFHPELPFRITDVILDKTSVCRGEKVTITIKAEDDRGLADWLLPNIMGKAAWTATMVVPGRTPGRFKFPLSLMDPDHPPAEGEPFKQETGAFVELKDCDATNTLGVGVGKSGGAVEDVIVGAKYHSSSGDSPASYLWDFADGTAPITTKDPKVRHVFPNEVTRGPGKRVTTYLIKASALDSSGTVLANGVVDFSLRNKIEEDERTRHSLELFAQYNFISTTDADGNHTMDVTLWNWSAKQTAVLKSLEYHLQNCEGKQAHSTIETHGVGEVFSGGSVPPRGSVSGRMVWPAGSKDVCTADVQVTGVSEPFGDPVTASFSMQVLLEGPLVTQLPVTTKEDWAAGEALAKAEEKLHKKGLTQADLDKLVADGDLDPAVLERIMPKTPIHPIGPHK